MTECFFCDEINRGPNRNFASRYPEVASRIAWTDGCLFAMPCIGQLQPNHFMIMPIDHHATLRETAAQIDQLDERIDDAVKSVFAKLRIGVTRALVFEHGARNPNDGGCGIYHAHLHVVPVTQDFDLPAVLDLDMPCEGRTLVEVFCDQPMTGSYALAGFWGERLALESLSAPLPSQYMRRKLSTAFNLPHWDWRESWREPAILTAVASVGAR